MALSREEIQELGQILAARLGEGRTARPKFRVVTPPKPALLDPIFRRAHEDRIRTLAKRYRLEWLVQQATFDVYDLCVLEDQALIDLLADVEKARECIADGISFEDAGLVRNVSDRSPRQRVTPSRSAIAESERASIGTANLSRVERSFDYEKNPPF